MVQQSPGCAAPKSRLLSAGQGAYLSVSVAVPRKATTAKHSREGELCGSVVSPSLKFCKQETCLNIWDNQRNVQLKGSLSISFDGQRVQWLRW